MSDAALPWPPIRMSRADLSKTECRAWLDEFLVWASCGLEPGSEDEDVELRRSIAVATNYIADEMRLAIGPKSAAPKPSPTRQYFKFSTDQARIIAAIEAAPGIRRTDLLRKLAGAGAGGRLDEILKAAEAGGQVWSETRKTTAGNGFSFSTIYFPVSLSPIKNH